MSVEHTLPLVRFDTLGWVVIDWIEEMLVRGRGDVQGSPVKLDAEECLHVLWCYRLWPRGHELEGRRMVHKAIYSRSKGAAKSELTAMIACVEALGPCRFGGWDANGEPVGIEVVDPFIRIAATEESQSGHVYEHITFMLETGRVHQAYNFDIGRSAATSTRIFLKPTGSIVPSTSGDVSKDGGRETFAALDESHLMITPQLRKMAQVISNNTGKRMGADPWMHMPTTAWLPGERSVVELAYDKYGQMPVEEAVTEHGVLFDMRQGDSPKIFNRDDSLMIALRTAYGPFKDWIDLHKIVRLIRDAEDPMETGYRYFLNQPRAGATTWLQPAEIKRAVGEIEVAHGEAIAVGFDGSESDDHTALMGCTEAGDLFTIGLWAPKGEPHWREDVNEAVDWTFENFKVVRFYGDPAWWQEEMLRWAQKHGSPPIVEFWTAQRNESKVAVATGALKTAITREDDDERITIDPVPKYTDEIKLDGKSLLVAHFENARARKRRIRIEDKVEDLHILRKEQSHSPLKIDGAIASILARRARDDAMRENEFTAKTYARAAW